MSRAYLLLPPRGLPTTNFPELGVFSGFRDLHSDFPLSFGVPTFRADVTQERQAESQSLPGGAR